MDEYHDNYGNTWITGECLTFGQYGGSGTIGAANQRWLSEYAADDDNVCNLMEVHGARRSGKKLRFTDYTSYDADMSDADIVFAVYCTGTEAYINKASKCPDLVKCTQAIADYPAYNDEIVSEIENEWEMRAWDDWLRDELIDSTGEVYKNLPAFLRSAAFFKIKQHEGLLLDAYLNARDAGNVHAEFEYDGMWIDVSKLKDTFCSGILRMVRQYYKDAWDERMAPMRRRMIALPGLLPDGSVDPNHVIKRPPLSRVLKPLSTLW